MPVSRLYAALVVRARIVTVLTGLLAIAVLTNEAGAVTKLWTGGTSSDWSIASNWLPLGAPGSSDSVQFPLAGANRNVNLAGNRTVADVAFTSSDAYRLSNNQLTITSGDIASTLGNHRIDSNVVLGGLGSWSIPSGKLSVYGSVNSTTGNTFGIDKTGTGTLEFLNLGATNILNNYLHQAGTAEFYEGTYTLTSTTFDAFSAMYMAEGTVTISHRAKIKGTSTGNLVLQSGGAGSSNLIIRDEQTEVATLGQIFLGASGTSGNSLTVTHGAKIRDIGLFVAGFNGNATVTIANEATVNSNGVAVGMLTGVTSTLTVEDSSSALTTSFLALGGYNSAQKGGTGMATIRDRASLAVSGELRFFSSTSSLTVDAASASIGALTNDAGVVGSIKLRNDGGTPALTLITPATEGAPGPFTFDGVISNASNNSGGIVKQGLGEQVFTKQNTYTGGTRIEAGTLTLGTSNTLSPTGHVEIAGGTLDLGGHAQNIGNFNLTSGTLTGDLGSTLLANHVVVNAGTIAAPIITQAGITKQGSGTVIATGPVTAGELLVLGGVFDAEAGVNGTVNAAAGAQVKLRGTLNGTLLGLTGSTVTLTGATVVLGGVTSDSTLQVGGHTLALTSPSQSNVRATTIAGGVVTSHVGFLVGSTLSGHGVIAAPIGTNPAIPPASITALGGPLTLGTFAVTDSLSGYTGSLTAGVQQLTLLSSGFTTLGNAATVNGGAINSINGVQVSALKSLSGHGVINGPLKNLGIATGGSGANVLRFTGPVTGTGSFQANVQFEHTYSPGASPAIVNFTGDPVFAATSRLEVELGGRTQGTQYDHLNVNGELTLAGTLRVSLIDNFQPIAGDEFDILDWATLDGAFATLELPTLSGFMWDVSQLHIDGLLRVIPQFDADFDSNGRVDAADLTILRDGFGMSGGRAIGDATGDGIVTGSDFLVWQRQFGSGVTATPTTAALPEPAAAVLVAFALPLLLRRRLRA
jgi:fibronectin-binding autotransporter adhesin